MSSAIPATPGLFPPRRIAIWLGNTIPLSLESQCLERGMRVMTHSGDLDNESLSKACAVVMPISEGTDPAVIRALLGRARMHGLLSVLAMDNGTTPEAYFSVTSAVVGDPPDRVIAPYQDWRAVTHEIDRHDSGPGHEDVELVGDLTGLSPEGRLLVQRAFSDVQTLELAALKGGKSGAGVWRARATGTGAENIPHPLLVKVGPLDKIREEQVKYHQFIKRKAHWKHVPRLVDERYAQGDQLGLLVQDFVDQAVPLAHALEYAAPGPVMANLFDVALSGCHGPHDRGVGSLAQAFVDLKVLKWHRPALEVAAEAARATSSDLPTVSQLRSIWDELPNTAYRRGVIHADLHTGNLFSSANSPDVIVIDFTNAAFGPVVADHACLEVSLLFPTLDDGDLSTPLPKESLEKVYTHPLVPTSAPSSAPGISQVILNCVRAVRVSAMAAESSPSVYTLAVAAYLLRFASFDDQGIGRRRLAYAMASRLVQAVAGQAPKP